MDEDEEADDEDDEDAAGDDDDEDDEEVDDEDLDEDDENEIGLSYLSQDKIDVNRLNFLIFFNTYKCLSILGRRRE